MQRLITSTSGGKELELDRCGECGGLWFDAGELELLATHRALPAGPGFEHFCPSCSDPRRDPGVGGQFAAARCNGCSGTWLDGATVKGLVNERLPQPPDPRDEPASIGFRCASCAQRFPYEEGNITARGLVCLACLQDGKPVAPESLGSTLDAVLRFLMGG